MSFLNSEISYCLSSKAITNSDLAKGFPDVTAEGIFAKTGISVRFQTEGDIVASDLGFLAAQKLFKEYNIRKDTIDFIIFVSSCLDYKSPTTACVLQERLGLNINIGAIDILHGCTGFIYGLSTAKGLIATNQASRVLLITADSPTKLVHPKDIDLLSIFSDGAAASIVSAKELDGCGTVGQFVFGTDGAGAKNLMSTRSGMKNPTDAKWFKEHINVPSGLKWGKLEMNSSQIFIFSIRTVPKLVNDILIKESLAIEEIDLFVFHQANGVMLDFLRSKLKIPKKKFYINIENKGNTVSGTIPIALKDAFSEGLITKGCKVLVAGFGIGYSWGGTVIRY
jgi:3-oxoacyl-[acyl-carrier-protein] synthase III